MGEPLKNKGTEGIKFVDFIIDLFKNQAEVLSKQDGVEASLNEDGVKEMQRKGKEMLGNTKVYETKEIKSAVEWLKERIWKFHIDYGSLSTDFTLKEIDKAFPDLNTKNSDKAIKTCGDCGGKMTRKTEDVFIEVNSANSEKPIYLSACENKFKLNTKNSKEVKKQ